MAAAYFIYLSPFLQRKPCKKMKSPLNQVLGGSTHSLLAREQDPRAGRGHQATSGPEGTWGHRMVTSHCHPPASSPPFPQFPPHITEVKQAPLGPEETGKGHECPGRRTGIV